MTDLLRKEIASVCSDVASLTREHGAEYACRRYGLDIDAAIDAGRDFCEGDEQYTAFWVAGLTAGLALAECRRLGELDWGTE